MSTQSEHANLAEAFERIVRHRRSIRLFDGAPMPERDVEKCLELAVLAPSSSNMQPWEFYWVRTPEKKAALVKACLSQAAAATASELVVCVARTATWRRTRQDMLAQLAREAQAGTRIPDAVSTYYRRDVKLMYTQGPLSVLGSLKRLVSFLVGLRAPIMRDPMSHHGMRIWAMKSTALACENLMLAATALGYDSCPLEGFDAVRVRRLLSLPRDARVAMVVALGKRRADRGPLPQIREDHGRHIHRL